MAPRRGGGVHIGGSSGGSGGGISCSSCDGPLAAWFYHLYSKPNIYGQLVVNAILAAALLIVFFVNRRPAVKLVHLAAFCFFAACVFQCVRWGLTIPDNWVPHGYRYESSVIVLLQRLGWPVLLAAMVRAMRPGKILGAGPWVGVFVVGVLNLTYVVYDFILTDLAVKDWSQSQGPWLLGDRDFSLLWSKNMGGRFLNRPGYDVYPLTWNQDSALRYRTWLLYSPHTSNEFKSRDTQIKIGLAADVVTLLLVLVIGGLHLVTWRRQGKAELPRRRSFLAVAVGGLLLSSLFRVIISARWILHNWKIITNAQSWENWLDYFPDTNRLDDYVYAPEIWLPGYRYTVEAFPILQVLFEQIGPVVACALIVLSMTAERRRLRGLQQQEAVAVKMQQVHYN